MMGRPTRREARQNRGRSGEAEQRLGLRSRGDLVRLATTTAPGTAPGTTPGAAGGGIGDYWWIILAVIVIAAAIWYFMRGRNRV
jgi:uncharacterized protein HemX